MADLIAKKAWTATLAPLLLRPPSWTRLEPQSLSGDPGPGLSAAVSDPLWLLTRQWQFGEFAGEDAGTPLAVRVDATIAPVARWQPGDWTATEPQAVRDLTDEPLDVSVEREPIAGRPGLRVLAQAGAALLTALRDAGLSASADSLIRTAPLPFGDKTGPGWTGPDLLLRGRAVDAEIAAAALEQASPNLPGWLDGPQRTEILEVTNRWREWYRSEIAPSTDASSWVGRRLEHRYSVGISTGTALRAPEAAGGAADWWTFDSDPTDLGPRTDPQSFTHRSVATPLRFPGMPADRFWEFEDAQIDIGALESDPHDLARLLVAECALIFGCDWLVIPIDLPARSLATVTTVTYRNTFGETYLAANAPARDRILPEDPWRMFTITAPDKAWENRSGAHGIDGLFVPPASISCLEGLAVEEVLFLRDEAANLVWGVERIVEDLAGDPHLRQADHHTVEPPVAGRIPDAELDYLLQTSVPEWWIPYVARIEVDGPVRLALVRSTLLRFGEGLPPSGVPICGIGRLLNEPGHAVLDDAEVPREGVRVQRVPVLARRSDGSYDNWTARRVSVGRGEGRSGLEYDSAIPRREV